MTNSRSDEELLRDYAEESSDDAFRALVHRHLNFVFGIAHRRTGKREMAEEVTQRVFIILARKARKGLKKRSTLTSWFHQTTLYQSSQAWRSERRRLIRMKRVMDYEQLNQQAEENNLEELRPILDEVIGKLSERDRTAILARFFEDKSYREIGHLLNKTEEAARKVTTRALNQLRIQLERYGITVSVSVLGAFLTKSAAGITAPSGLANSVIERFLGISSCADAANVLTVKSILTMTTTKSLLIGVFSGGFLGFLWMPMSQRASGSSHETLPEIQSTSLVGGRQPTRSLTKTVLPPPAATAAIAFREIEQLLAEPDTEINRLRLRELLRSLPADQFPDLLAMVTDRIKRSWHLQRILPALARSWATSDPNSALRAMMTCEGTTGWPASKLTTEAFVVWHQNESERALAWLIGHQHLEELEVAIPMMVSEVAKTLAADSEEKVLQWASALDGEDFKRATAESLWAAVRDTHFESEHGVDVPALLDRLEKVEDHQLSKLATRTLLNDWAAWRNDEYEAWLEEQSPGPLAYEAALAGVRLRSILQRKGNIKSGRAVSAEDHLDSAERALRLAPHEEPSAAVEEILTEARVVPRSFLEWALPKLSGPGRDDAILRAAETAHKVTMYSSLDPPPRQALDWIRHHSDPKIRDPLIERYYTSWLENKHLNHAESFIEDSDWPESLKTVLRRVKANHEQP